MFSTLDPALREKYKVAHLLRRAGFGYTAEELAKYTALGFDAAVTDLVNFDPNVDYAADNLKQPVFDYDKLEPFQTYWIARMFYTKAPLQEKMALFWHSHFATSDAKVHNRWDMWQQNQIYRNQALDTFDSLLKSVARDPAMLIWLDNSSSHKKKPNENWGRELMELFTMGVGNYSEDDVKSSARSFTGWSVKNSPPPPGVPQRPNQVRGEFLFREKDHDYDNKTFLGQTGPFDGDDILDILVQQPATARFISRKLWEFFVWEQPDASIINRLSQVYFDNNYSIKAVVEAIFRSPEFVSDDAFHSNIKSPVEFLVGTLKYLNVSNVPTGLPAALKNMGEDLFHPPSVAGWPGGRSWITTSTFYQRANTINTLLTYRSNIKNAPLVDPAVLTPTSATTPSAVVDFYADLLLHRDIADNDRQDLINYLTAGDGFNSNDVGNVSSHTVDEKVRGLLHLMMTSTSYQLN